MDRINIKTIIFDDDSSLYQEVYKALASPEKLEQGMLVTNQPVNATQHIEPSFLIDRFSNFIKGVDAIQQALQKNSPFSIAFIGIDDPYELDKIHVIKQIITIDNNIQVVLCTESGEKGWDKALDGLHSNANVVLLKKPYNSKYIFQLACLLAKKWLIACEEKECNVLLNQFLGERGKSLEESLIQNLEYQATHDGLTKLPNRILIVDRIEQSIAKAKRHKNLFALLFFDLDRFKLINDSMSHEYGDLVLRAVANRLSKIVREEDTLGRFGGDEFVMIFPSLKSAQDAVQVAQKILDAFQRPFNIRHKKVNLRTSVGISLYPQDGKSVKQLLRRADLAMYNAKEQGGDQFRFYKEMLNQQSVYRLKQELELKRALSNGEFFLVYQPEYNIEQEMVLAAEALLRWEHPEKGVILPLDFIPDAERTGLIVPIGEWVLDEVCKQHQEWKNEGLPPIKLSVNISINQLRQHEFAKRVKKILQKYHVEPEYIAMEITENILLVHPEVVHMVSELKKLGVRIMLDDFGSGRASLNHLRKLEIDGLKIDSSFVRNITLSQNDELVIKAIIAMAKNLDFDVIAEGVENEKQNNFLRDLHCETMQGYQFSKPLNVQEITKVFQHSFSSSS